jgi:hypothetical protein
MSSLADEFTEFLVEVIEADGNTAYVSNLLANARASIAGGKGTIASITGSSLNGKTFNRSVHLTPMEVARACQRALKIHAGQSADSDGDDAIVSTYPDFRSLSR